MDIPSVATGAVSPRDDRIYEDSKVRPVGIAAIFNRITNTLERPKMIPSMTPEDKRMLDTLVTRCIGHAEAYLRSQGRTAKKKEPISSWALVVFITHRN